MATRALGPLLARSAACEEHMIASDRQNAVGVVCVRDQVRTIAEAYNDVELLVDAIARAAVQWSGGGVDPVSPLSTITRSTRVLIKPNWVLDHNRSGASMDCMITHLAFVEAVTRLVLRSSPHNVTIADAPIQSARFEQIVPRHWQDRIRKLGADIPVEIIDFRNVITDRDARGNVRVVAGRRADRLVTFDLGSSSLLDEISAVDGRFRCTNYSPDRIQQVQRQGVHKYVICREALEADVVINVPKLKTHSKAGITAALKNLVGINGDKDYLPHHRVGSPREGGDCYDRTSVRKRTAERLLDIANRRIGQRGHRIASLIAAAGTRAAVNVGIGGLEGAWYGNDTVWRMTLDLNRILLYGREDGTMSDSPQRKVFSITDAVIAGQGEGPLSPIPIDLGVVTFASSSVHADVVHAALMQFDPERIPLLSQAFRQMRWPLASGSPKTSRGIASDNRELEPSELRARFGQRFSPPRGWRGHLEVARDSR
jgi:uncharacterized protein (DUF362 family)